MNHPASNGIHPMVRLAVSLHQSMKLQRPGEVLEGAACFIVAAAQLARIQQWPLEQLISEARRSWADKGRSVRFPDLPFVSGRLVVPQAACDADVTAVERALFVCSEFQPDVTAAKSVEVLLDVGARWAARSLAVSSAVWLEAVRQAERTRWFEVEVRE